MLKVLCKTAEFDAAINNWRAALLAFIDFHATWYIDLAGKRFGEHLFINQSDIAECLIIKGQRVVQNPVRSLTFEFSEGWHFTHPLQLNQVGPNRGITERFG